MDKKELRSILKQRREGLSDEKRRLEEKKAYEWIFQSALYKSAKHILCYSSYGTEFDTMPIIQKAWEDGKKVYLPRVLGKHEMEFYNVCDLTNLLPGAYGIMEPDLSRPAYCFLPEETSVMLMPGLGFDRAMNRIGYGMGFYDTYLSKIHGMDGYHKEAFFAVGICYGCQLVEQVYVDERDQQLDVIVAGDKGVFLP